MIHPDQIKEAGAYCAGRIDEVDARMWLDSIEHPHEFREKIILIEKERDDLLNSLAATCRERDGLRQLIKELQLRQSGIDTDLMNLIDEDDVLKAKLRELKGKIARVKGLLIGAGQAYSPTRTKLNIDAVLEELQ